MSIVAASSSFVAEGSPSTVVSAEETTFPAAAADWPVATVTPGTEAALSGSSTVSGIARSSSVKSTESDEYDEVELDDSVWESWLMETSLEHSGDSRRRASSSADRVPGRRGCAEPRMVAPRPRRLRLLLLA